MTSILPGETSPWQIIDKAIGGQLSQNLPGAIQQGYQRQLGLNALGQAEQDIANAGGDPYKIAMAFAKAGTQNPNLERALGPLLQTALQGAKTRNAYGEPTSTGQGVFPPSPQQGFMTLGQGGATVNGQQIPRTAENQQEIKDLGAAQAQPSEYATPSPFNIFTKDQMDAEARRYANAVNDPNGYAKRFAELQAQNETAITQKAALEDMVLKSGVNAEELPRFILVGSKFDTRNPAEWMQKTKRKYDEVKSNDKKLEKAFIPGIGSGLLGRDREKALKRLDPIIKEQVDAGLEQETRKFLAENYLSPTEVAERIHPLSPEKIKAIDKLPRSFFPLEKKQDYIPGTTIRKDQPKSPFISYLEAQEKAPKELKRMQDNLANFFLKNLDKNTSPLALRDKIIKDKDYYWEQIGPAIRQAEKMGLKLEPFQSTEMVDIETQPPLESLPDMFQDWARFTQFLRGAK